MSGNISAGTSVSDQSFYSEEAQKRLLHICGYYLTKDSVVRKIIDPDLVWAVIMVESRGNGYNKVYPSSDYGNLVILYEPHVFSRYTNHIYDEAYPNISYKKWKTKPYPSSQSERYKQLWAACRLSRRDAYRSISMGAFQLMGFNYLECGYSDPQDMYLSFSKSLYNQITAFFNFLSANETRSIISILYEISSIVMSRDSAIDKLPALFTKFARRYNGDGQVGYDKKITDRYFDLRSRSLYKNITREKTHNVIDVDIIRARIMRVQLMLNFFYKDLIGFVPLVVDGDFGDKTYNLVKMFQTKFNLFPDGIVGTATYDTLLLGRIP